METNEFAVERIDVVTTRSFAETVAVFEKRVPPANLSTFVQLITGRATAGEVETAVGDMAGDSGFMALAKIDQGPLTSLLGKPKKISMYIIGNPLLANRMFEHNPAAGVYAPLRVAIYEDYAGACHLTYDRPSTLLAQFGNPEILTVAKLLDEKMTALAVSLVE